MDTANGRSAIGGAPVRGYGNCGWRAPGGTQAFEIGGWRTGRLPLRGITAKAVSALYGLSTTRSHAQWPEKRPRHAAETVSGKRMNMQANAANRISIHWKRLFSPLCKWLITCGLQIAFVKAAFRGRKGGVYGVYMPPLRRQYAVDGKMAMVHKLALLAFAAPGGYFSEKRKSPPSYSQ